jgi:hypothetical protein
MSALSVGVTLFGILLSAFSQQVLAQSGTSAALSVPQCDQLLDASYDRLSDAEKQARLASYGGCRKSKADQHLRRQYQAARSELRQWKGSAKVQAREQIREHGSTATNIMTAQHKIEREAHKQDFGSRVASLKQQSDAMSSSEYNAELAAINEERGATFKVLQEQQQQEKRDLAKEVKDSNTTVNQEIEELAQQEKESLFRQFQEKAKHIQRWYGEILNSPFEETPNETNARNGSTVDNPVIGRLSEIEGTVIITRADGTKEEGRPGVEVYFRDVINTSEDGAANIRLVDDTNFVAVAENARLQIDEYIYDPETEGGTRNFSILRGVFLFTSGLIGRDDPDDVEIDTPLGSIGIRG